VTRQQLAIPPPSSDADSNKLAWPGNAKGNYTVAAIYQMMCGHSNIDASEVWKLKVSKLNKCFIWQTYHERLFTDLKKSRMQ